MDKVSKDIILKDAWALKISLDAKDVDYYVSEVNKFISKHPKLDLSGVKPLRYVNEDVCNVFMSCTNELASVEDVMKNVSDREGNYIKVPKVL